ncbi:MAG: nuclear transport factor 2 family protein [Phycisphaeraceae bacterium]|nr:nuclear transport factor 2 family protein [Phycisphaeraceae bacterium]
MKTRSLVAGSFIAVVGAVAWNAASKPAAQPDDDASAVRQAVLDYVEGIYEGDPSRIERSVRPDLTKLGFQRPGPGAAYGPIGAMTFDQLVNLAATFHASGHIPEDATFDIVVFDVTDQTASVKLTAFWGMDYMHLAKFDGRWQIINVLWQTPPDA